MKITWWLFFFLSMIVLSENCCDPAVSKHTFNLGKSQGPSACVFFIPFLTTSEPLQQFPPGFIRKVEAPQMRSPSTLFENGKS